MEDKTFTKYFERIIESVIKRIEGGDDPRRKYDYLTKLDEETMKSLANLSESQLDSMAECCWLGETFPSLMPLKDLVVELAKWSPSKGGKRAEQLTATMISQETHVVPTILNSQFQDGKKKKEKETKE